MQAKVLAEVEAEAKDEYEEDEEDSNNDGLPGSVALKSENSGSKS